jgi:hypothetical protein
MTAYNAHARGDNIFCSIAIPIAILAVILRFFARARSHQKYGFEDWFAVVTLLLFLGYCALLLYGIDPSSTVDNVAYSAFRRESWSWIHPPRDSLPSSSQGSQGISHQKSLTPC